MISLADLDFLGLRDWARVSSRNRPKFAFNSVRPLLLTFEKINEHFSLTIVMFKLYILVFNTTITYIN